MCTIFPHSGSLQVVFLSFFIQSIKKEIAKNMTAPILSGNMCIFFLKELTSYGCTVFDAFQLILCDEKRSQE